jgi:biotin transport system substrate-specific component
LRRPECDEPSRLIAVAVSTRPSGRTVALQAVLCAGLTALCARIAFPLPFTPVPVTLQVAAVVFCGLSLPPLAALSAQALYLAAGLLGAPVFAYGNGGAGYLLNPMGTGGYLLSYPLAAFAVSSLAGRWRSKGASGDLSAGLCGVGIVYAIGCAWLGSWHRLSPAAAILQGAGWFLFWDGAKALAAVLAARAFRGAPHSH